MALSFPCAHCGREIVTRFLHGGEPALCRACGEQTAVPFDSGGAQDRPPFAERVSWPALADKTDTTRPRGDFPGLIQSAGLSLGSLFLGGIVLAVVVGFARPHVSKGMVDSLLLLHGDVAAVIGVAIAAWYSRLSWREFVPLRPVAPALLLAVVITILGGIILISEAVTLFSMVLPVPAWLNDLMNETLKTTPSIWGRLFLVAVLPGFFEEVFCRGVLLRGFLRRYSPARAILYSSIVFAAEHFNPWQAITAMALGSYFGWLYYRTRSLIPGVVGHTLNNSMYVLLSALPATMMPGLTGDGSTVTTLPPLWLVLVGLCLAAIGLGLTRRALRHQPGCESAGY